MGRLGNRLLIGGDPDLTFYLRAGQVVRLWLTNTANTRDFRRQPSRSADEAGRRGQRSG